MSVLKKTVLVVFLIGTILSGNSLAVFGQDATYWPQGPEVESAAAIVMEANTGTILYEKNIDDQHYPASITKIMTTLLAIENSSMDEIVTFSNDAVYKTEGSGIARDVGEQMTMEQCLYAVMLASANECAYAVGEHVAGGDINKFVEMMNEKAKALGCKNTNFSNCSGLPDDTHVTSAYDMALIAKAAYANETFRIITGTKTYTIPITNKHPDEETYLMNHHAMLYPLKTRNYLYEYCLGGKTGYTTAANSTLVTYAEKNGMTLICVVLNAQSPAHYTDTTSLFNFCFDNFKLWNIAENDTSLAEQSDSGVFTSQPDFVTIDTSSYVILPVTASFSDTTSTVSFDQVDESSAGNIVYSYGGRTVGQATVVATNTTIDTLDFKDSTETPTEENSQQIQPNDQLSNGNAPIHLSLNEILGGIGILLIIALVAFVLYKLIDNYYYIRRKIFKNKKEKSPYKKIRTNKMYRRRKK